MQLTCKNCLQRFKGNFCAYCGQPANTHRMDFHFLWHDIQHGILHIDKGFFYTVPQLFKIPGHAIREFLEGKRVKHFKPIPLLFILAGVYALLSHYFQVDFVQGLKISKGSSQVIVNVFQAIKEWISKHYAFTTILGLPLYAAGSYLAFRKWRYNFIEHIVIIAFYESQVLVVRIISFPIYYFYNGSAAFKSIWMAINFCLFLWTMSQFFYTEKKLHVFLRVLLSYFISFVIIIALLLIFIFSLIIYSSW